VSYSMFTHYNTLYNKLSSLSEELVKILPRAYPDAILNDLLIRAACRAVTAILKGTGSTPMLSV
jgi:hypothetical protein